MPRFLICTDECVIGTNSIDEARSSFFRAMYQYKHVWILEEFTVDEAPPGKGYELVKDGDIVRLRHCVMAFGSEKREWTSDGTSGG